MLYGTPNVAENERKIASAIHTFRELPFIFTRKGIYSTIKKMQLVRFKRETNRTTNNGFIDCQFIFQCILKSQSVWKFVTVWPGRRPVIVKQFYMLTEYKNCVNIVQCYSFVHQLYCSQRPILQRTVHSNLIQNRMRELPCVCMDTAETSEEIHTHTKWAHHFSFHEHKRNTNLAQCSLCGAKSILFLAQLRKSNGLESRLHMVSSIQ